MATVATMRKPRDPFKYHVYVGCSIIFDSVVSFKIWDQLKSHGVASYFRSDPSASSEPPDLRISRGIRDSEKCLIYLSPTYMEDVWFQKEIDAASEKARRYGDGLLILLADRNISKTMLPETLRNWPLTVIEPDEQDSDQFWNNLLEKIVESPPIKLALLPELINGYSSACSYYTGYLRLVLPDFVERITESILDPHPELRTNCVSKMLIICPQSCYCPPSIEDPGKIDHTDMFVLKTVNRAGGKNRDMKTTLFKITDDVHKQVYYFAGELANPLMTLYDIFIDGLSGMTEEQLYRESTYFFLTLEGLFNHPDNANCRDQFKLLVWTDPKSKQPNPTTLHEFLLSTIRDELAHEEETAVKTVLYERSRSENEEWARYNYINVPVKGSNPGCVYDERKIDQYKMERTPRGICLIISISNYQKDLGLPSSRPGTKIDEKTLKDIFARFHFDVEIHVDLTSATLDMLVDTMASRSHDNYDAFVCCVLSHGKHKVINTSDGEEKNISEILDMFSPSNCPSLKDKPKLFFIQISHMAAIRESQDDSDASQTPEIIDNNMERNYFRSESVDCTPVFEESEEIDSAVKNFEACKTIIQTDADERTQTEKQEADAEMQGETEAKAEISMTEAEIQADAEDDQIVESMSVKSDAEPIETVSSPPVYTRSSSRQSRLQLVPRYPDCLLSYALIPHSAPRLNLDSESPFVKALSDNLRKTVEITPAMTSVRDQVSQILDELALTGKMSLPDHVSTMSKLLYF